MRPWPDPSRLDTPLPSPTGEAFQAPDSILCSIRYRSATEAVMHALSSIVMSGSLDTWVRYQLAVLDGLEEHGKGRVA